MRQKNMYENKRGGYIALISAVIISAIVLLLTSSLSFMSFYERFDILDAEFKERSAALAEACIDSAIVKLVEDDSYAGNETKTLGGDTCTIRPIVTSGGVTTVETQGVFQNSYTNLRVTVTAPLFEIQSWLEVPTF